MEQRGREVTRREGGHEGGREVMKEEVREITREEGREIMREGGHEGGRSRGRDGRCAYPVVTSAGHKAQHCGIARSVADVDGLDKTAAHTPGACLAVHSDPGCPCVEALHKQHDEVFHLGSAWFAPNAIVFHETLSLLLMVSSCFQMARLARTSASQLWKAASVSGL